MTNPKQGAIIAAIQALELISDEWFEHRKSEGFVRLHTEGIRQAVNAIDRLQTEVIDAVPVTDLTMAVIGGKDTQEARTIKHEAAKILAEGVRDE